MDIRVLLVSMLLLEPRCQRCPQAGAVSFSQRGEFTPSEDAVPSSQISKISQTGLDLHLIRSKLGAQAKPYSLSLSPDDYHHYLPKPKRLRTSRLMKLLGSSYDPFWMSIEEPQDQNASLEGLGTLNQELAEHTMQFQKKLFQETEGLDLSGLLTSENRIPHNLSQTIIHHFQQWLVDTATCHLTSSWVDMGSIFWPRWIRHTDCDLTYGGCSWPRGMTCKPAKVTHIRLLAWHCWINRDQSQSPGRSLQQCSWRQIPYPVVAACKCTC
ncbi:noggin-1-like [Pogona vitticeps]